MAMLLMTQMNSTCSVLNQHYACFEPGYLVTYEIEECSVAELVSVAMVSSGDAKLSYWCFWFTIRLNIVSCAIKWCLRINQEQDAFFTLVARFGIPAVRLWQVKMLL